MITLHVDNMTLTLLTQIQFAVAAKVKTELNQSTFFKPQPCVKEVVPTV
jgi:hypothetical protein